MEPRPATPDVNNPDDSSTTPKPAGVRIYLNKDASVPSAATTPANAPAVVPAESGERAPSRAVLLSLFAADLLLCLLAWRLVSSSESAVGWAGWLLAAAAITLGAWLSVLAVRSALGSSR